MDVSVLWMTNLKWIIWVITSYQHQMHSCYRPRKKTLPGFRSPVESFSSPRNIVKQLTHLDSIFWNKTSPTSFIPKERRCSVSDSSTQLCFQDDVTFHCFFFTTSRKFTWWPLCKSNITTFAAVLSWFFSAQILNISYHQLLFRINESIFSLSTSCHLVCSSTKKSHILGVHYSYLRLSYQNFLKMC